MFTFQHIKRQIRSDFISLLFYRILTYSHFDNLHKNLGYGFCLVIQSAPLSVSTIISCISTRFAKQYFVILECGTLHLYEFYFLLSGCLVSFGFHKNMRYIVLTLCFLVGRSMAQNENYTAALVTHYKNALLAFEKQDFDQAKTHFNTCLQNDSTCFEAYLGLAQVFFAENKLDSALWSCEKGAVIRPFNPALTGLMGRCYFYTTDFADAETFLKRAISIGEDTPENNLILALALQNTGNYKEALHYFDRSIHFEPNNSAIWYNRGLLFSEMELYEKARLDFERAHQLAPEEASISAALSQSLFNLKAYEEALASADEGLKYATPAEKINLLLLKGKYYALQEDYENAMLYYDYAAEIEQGNPVVLTHQASVFLATENFSAAVEKCNAAIAADPEQMEAYFNRGIANEMMRDIEGACNDWQKAFVLGSQRAIEYLNGPVCNE